MNNDSMFIIMVTNNDKKLDSIDKKHKRVLGIKLREREEEMLDKVLSIVGCSISEFFREHLRNEYKKLVPYTPIKKGKPIIEENEEEYTLEHKCEMVGGKVVVDKYGSTVCRRILYKNQFSEGNEELPMTHSSLNEKIKELQNEGIL